MPDHFCDHQHIINDHWGKNCWNWYLQATHHVKHFSFFLYKVITFYIFKIVFFFCKFCIKNRCTNNIVEIRIQMTIAMAMLVMVFFFFFRSSGTATSSAKMEKKHKDFTSKFVYATSAYVCCMRIEICVFYFVERIFSHTISFIWPIVYSLFKKGDNV